MKIISKFAAVIGAGLAASLAFGSTANSQMAPFGDDESVAYAAKIWSAMEKLNLAGDNALLTFPYEGTDPHGMMLETFYTKATIDGYTGALIVKRNYGPAGVEADAVLNDPAKHLGAVTVMFRREAGYDDDNKNWFWVKYLPDGSLDKNPKGMQLAGKIAKGADKGCIACHTGAPGGDMVFTTDRKM
ncbi:MAG: cytochrome P460 family protein [Rhizobiaceae bacterium]|nr:cytochrome P460 family protein [Rhizobiaceae bacterium]